MALGVSTPLTKGKDPQRGACKSNCKLPLESRTDQADHRSSSFYSPVPEGQIWTPSISMYTPSEASFTPSVVEEVSMCHFDDCSATYTGQYQRGNLGRHIRLVHNAVRYPCSVHGCERVFNRQDARLNHYRRVHTEDLPLLRPPLPRNNQRRRRFT